VFFYSIFDLPLMANAAPVIACLFIGFLVLSASELTGLHLLPSWAALSVSKIGSIGRVPGDDADMNENSGPEAVLLHQLKDVDTERDPEKAYSLRAAIGNILRASGTQNAEALRHFEAARDIAVRLNDPDTQLLAHLDVSEALLDVGRILDSQRENTAASAFMAKHFIEIRSRLNRGRGRAKFELGFTDNALSYFDEAQKAAVTPEDKVRSTCLTAMARTCLGQATQTIQPLKQALEALQEIRKAGGDGGMPAVVQDALSAEVHFRLAEAFHSMDNDAFADAHYKKALHLERKAPLLNTQRISALKMGITMLKHHSPPDLRCPTISNLPWHAKPQGPPKTTSNSGFMAKIDLLQAEKKFDVVESELKASLSSQARPYKGLDAATALNMLGDLYLSQKNHAKAAKHFRQALSAAIVCCGGGNEHAKKAYEGLEGVKGELSPDDQRVAQAAINRYLDVVESGYQGENPKVAAAPPQEAIV